MKYSDFQALFVLGPLFRSLLRALLKTRAPGLGRARDPSLILINLQKMRFLHQRRQSTQQHCSLVTYPNQLDPVPNLCIVIIMILGLKPANLSFLVVVVEMPTILSLSRIVTKNVSHQFQPQNHRCRHQP